MRILPIQLHKLSYTNNSEQIQQSKYLTKYNKTTSLLQTPIVDSVSFAGHRHAPNAELLKALLPYRIPDLYSEIILIDPKMVDKMFETNLFSRPIKNIVKVLGPYNESLFPVEKRVFQLMKRASVRNPNMKLDELFGRLAPSYSKKLLKVQIPIFEELNTLAKEMPADLYEEYNYLMHVTNKKLSNEEMLQPFSMKEFQYKLGRIKERIDKSKNKEAKKTIDKMINMTKNVPVVSKKKRMNKDFPIKKFERKQAESLLKISEYFYHSPLKNDADLLTLMNESRLRVYKIPTNTKFNRKTFIHELKKITELLSDEKLARKMIQTVVKLPTSKESLPAFVMKAAGRSSEQIGFDLLSGSIGSTDHLLAKHKGGLDNICNYGLSSSFKNAEKAHERFSVVLRKDPKIRSLYAKRQMNRLIELSNDGTFKKIGLPKSYIFDFAHALEKLSYPEPPLRLDLSKLK